MHPIVNHGSHLTFLINTNVQEGVITERCYGCGRCFPVCPYDKISGCHITLS